MDVFVFIKLHCTESVVPTEGIISLRAAGVLFEVPAVKIVCSSFVLCRAS